MNSFWILSPKLWGIFYSGNYTQCIQRNRWTYYRVTVSNRASISMTLRKFPLFSWYSQLLEPQKAIYWRAKYCIFDIIRLIRVITSRQCFCSALNNHRCKIPTAELAFIDFNKSIHFWMFWLCCILFSCPVKINDKGCQSANPLSLDKMQLLRSKILQGNWTRNWAIWLEITVGLKPGSSRIILSSFSD